MTNNSLWKYIKELTVLDRFLFLCTVIGVVILFTGVFRGILRGSQVQVEYLESEKVLSEEKILVDVSGSVEKPGVYELSKNSRIIDALVMAGGMSVDADREYVEKNFNLAELLKDGQKIYVYKKNETHQGMGYTEAKSGGIKLNINTATEIELDTLAGIGSSRAKDIVLGRPYKSVDDLVEKGILSSSVVEKIRDSISAY